MTETEQQAGSAVPAAGRPGGALPHPRAVAVAVVAAALCWAYAPELRWLLDTWTHDPNYSHGFLVPVVAALIYWRRAPAAGDPRPWQKGWLVVFLALAAQAYTHEHGHQWASTMTAFPAMAGLALTLGGKPALRRAWPALAYLLFMVPLPSRINAMLSQPLQALATVCSTALLKLIGIWAIAEGNVIYVGREPLNVAEACNGLSMLMTLMATVVAVVLLLPLSNWLRALLVMTAGPIALASNVVRIVATGWCVSRFGAEAGGRMGHDLAGWLMMPLAMALVGLELLVLLWLVAEQEVVIQPTLLGKPLPGARAVATDALPGPERPGPGMA